MDSIAVLICVGQVEMMTPTQFDQSLDVKRAGMPDEGAPHARTWMAFGASEAIWDSMLAAIQTQLAHVANTIARFEPVSMLVRPADMDLARRLCHPSVELHPCALDDIWMRDSGPCFVRQANGDVLALDFNFNGWGHKQAHKLDQKVAAHTAKLAGVKSKRCNLVLEGGAIEVDGMGTALMTESSIVNENRNPGLSKAVIETRLKALLGLQHIIWLPGIRWHDITDAHIDFYARFVVPGVVLVHLDPNTSSYVHAMTLRHLDILRAAKDARGAPLTVILLEAPTHTRPEFKNEHFAAGYLNYYLVKNALIVPEFGDEKADGNARRVLQELYPEREIVAINIDCIAAGGGGIHCITQQEIEA